MTSLYLALGITAAFLQNLAAPFFLPGIVIFSPQRPYAISFIVGFFFDLLSGHVLGTTAVFLLSFCFLLNLLRPRFRLSFWLSLVFLVFSQLVFLMLYKIV